LHKTCRYKYAQVNRAFPSSHC